jgi:flagellar assembly protein FliH
MSSKAKRYSPSAMIESYDWGGQSVMTTRQAIALPMPAAPSEPSVDPAAIEKAAFLTGYQQGERAGLESAHTKGEQMLSRLAASMQDLQRLRADLLVKTERQVVELAVAMARRIVHRELALDHDLLLAMARVALDRLADVSTASIRLNPEDYAATVGRGQSSHVPGGVRIVADPAIARGGCLVQSDYGVIDVTATVQLDELAHSLLGDMPVAPAAKALDSNAA